MLVNESRNVQLHGESLEALDTLFFFRMVLRTLILLFLLVGTGFPKPRPKDNFLTNTIKKATGNAAKSLVDCQKTCHGPLYYCDSRLMITTRCRYTSLTWFLIIGLPLIIILILVGIFVWRKKRQNMA